MNSLPQHIKDVYRLPSSRTVAEWAEDSIVLDSRTSAIPGPIKLDHTPFIRKIVNSFADYRIRQITLLAGTQIVKTMACIICIDYAVDQDPGQAIWVSPIEITTKRFSKNRFIPILEASSVLRAHMTDCKQDVKGGEVYLDRMTINFAWSNSPALLAETPCRYAIMDEIDKYAVSLSREAGAKKLVMERLTTFWNSKVIVASTPTTPQGEIMVEWDLSDKHRYHVPCPHCGFMQPLTFSQIKWPKGESDPLRIERNRLAWYQCVACETGGQINEHLKSRIILAGQWERENPNDEPGPNIGFFLPKAPYSPWKTWSDMAAEFLRSKDSPVALRNFKNSWLAEPWEDRITGITVGDVEKRSRDSHERGKLPLETQMLTCGVDVHGPTKGLYWSIYAWGHGRLCWLVDYGIVMSWAELDAIITGRTWMTPDGTIFDVVFTGIDSGYNAPAVYDFTRERYPQFMPTKGRDEMVGTTIKDSPVDYMDPKTKKRYRGFQCVHINTMFYKDVIASYLLNIDDRDRLKFCRGVEHVFMRQLASEHKIRDGNKNVWVTKYSGADNHWLDCFVIAAAIADRSGLMRLTPWVNPKARRVVKEQVKTSNGFKTPHGESFVARRN